MSSELSRERERYELKQARFKVLPTALVASVMRPHMSRVELQSRLEDRVGKLAEAGANLSVRTARQAALEGVSALVARDVLVEEGQTLRVRDRPTH